MKVIDIGHGQKCINQWLQMKYEKSKLTNIWLNFDMYTLYLKWITNKVLLYNTESCSMLCGSLDRRVRIHVYFRLRPFAVHLKLLQRCKSALLQYKMKSLKRCLWNIILYQFQVLFHAKLWKIILHLKAVCELDFLTS